MIYPALTNNALYHIMGHIGVMKDEACSKYSEPNIGIPHFEEENKAIAKTRLNMEH